MENDKSRIKKLENALIYERSLNLSQQNWRVGGDGFKIYPGTDSMKPLAIKQLKEEDLILK